MWRRRAAVFVAVALLACTLAARLPSALSYALWEDEIGVQHVIALSTIGALRQVVTHESTPPAYYMFVRTIDRVARGLPVEARAEALRGLSIAFALACTWLTFALALRLLPLWSAALAGVLTSFGAVLVVHGSELRAYSLLALASVMFALALERAVSQATPRRLSELAGAVVLGSLTHYFFLLTLGAGALWFVIGEKRRTVRLRVAAALLVGLAPLAVWSPAWIHQWRRGTYATSPPFSLDRFTEVVASLFAPQAIVGNTGAYLRIAVTLALLIPAVLLLRRREGRLVALLTLVPLLSTAFLSWITGERVFNTRNLIGVAPFAAIVLAWACNSLPWRRTSFSAGVVVALLVAAGSVYGQTSLGRTPYDRIAESLRDQGLQDDEPIVWFGSDGGIAPVGWYLTMEDSNGVWPRTVRSAPTRQECSAVQVIALSEAGRLWLGDHREQISRRTSVTSFGDDVQGRRGVDIVVARLRWTNGILDFQHSRRNRFIFHVAGVRPPCVKP